MITKHVKNHFKRCFVPCCGNIKRYNPAGIWFLPMMTCEVKYITMSCLLFQISSGMYAGYILILMYINHLVNITVEMQSDLFVNLFQTRWETISSCSAACAATVGQIGAATPPSCASNLPPTTHSFHSASRLTPSPISFMMSAHAANYTWAFIHLKFTFKVY